MINFSLLAKKLNKPGMALDMLAQTATIVDISVKQSKLCVRVISDRNKDKNWPPDEYLFDQTQAKNLRVNEWRLINK